MTAYLNGQIAEIPFIPRSFGFVETMLYKNGTVPLLEKFIGRMRQSLTEYGLRLPENDWAEIINKTAGNYGTAEVNIYCLASAGGTDVLVTADTVPDAPEIFKLNINNRFETSHLHRHKPASSPHHELAQLRAVKGGYNGSLMFTEDNRALEASEGVLLFTKDGCVFTAPSGARLNCVMLQALAEQIKITETDILLKEFPSYESCFLLHPVHGVKTVSVISLFNFIPDTDKAGKLSGLLGY